VGVTAVVDLQESVAQTVMRVSLGSLISCPTSCQLGLGSTSLSTVESLWSNVQCSIVICREIVILILETRLEVCTQL
jgi:hypothetical protein